MGDLETTIATLGSANEELEATSAELRSANATLETLNAELRATNAELESLGEELVRRTDAALEATAFLTSILESIEQSVIVLDRELRVTAWSATAAELWGLDRVAALGRPLGDLPIGLPGAELTARLRADDGAAGEPIELAARDRAGRPVRCSVTFSLLRDEAEATRGVILVTHAEHRPEG